MVRYRAHAEIVSRMYLNQWLIDVGVNLKDLENLRPLILKRGREEVGRISMSRCCP